MYKDKGVLYPEEYVGLQKYHLRALHNVHEAAARKAFKDKIRHTAANLRRLRLVNLIQNATLQSLVS